MRNTLKITIPILAFLTLSLISCSRPGLPPPPPGNPPGQGDDSPSTFPGGDGGSGDGSAAGIDAPVGNDALSSSTNFSKKIQDPRTKADPLSGADFIAKPSISNYGSAALSYALDIPAGRAGVQPQISLSYSSSGGDGWVGIGWSLGLGAISRTTQYGQIYYDNRDTFTYNGKRLVKVSGSDTNENGIYRLEIDNGDFARLELTGVETGGVWKVNDKSGTVITFGESGDHRIYRPDDQNLTYTWQYSRTEDLNGNFMYAVYDNSEYAAKHILYLKELRYTGNSNADFPARQFARFYLKDRDDFYVSKAPGFIMKMDKLLDRIEIGWDDPSGSNNTVLWDYNLVYENSADSNRPLLKNIISSHNSTVPEFQYQPAVHTFAWQHINNIWSNETENNPETTKYFEGDFNGDGKSDMAFFNPVTGDWKVTESRHYGGFNFKTYGNRFQGYDGPGKIQWFKGNVTGDYNGDGKSDIAFYLSEKKEFWVAESTGNNFNFKLYGKFIFTDFDLFKAEWFTGDYDGNGISDVVLFDERSGSWIFMKNEGGGFSFVKFAENFQHLFRDDYNPGIAQNSPVTSDDSIFGKARGKVHWLIGDYNGDGRSDISFYDARDGKWWVAENYRDDALGFKLQWRLYKVFTAPEQTLFGFDRFSGDFNGDGFSDFLLFDRSKGQWWIGETGLDFDGSGTINFRIWSNMPEYKDITRWLQGDFNGDGRTDIGFYSKTDNNFWIGEATPDGFRYRVYNNLAYGGPDPAKVMAVPLPRDEVKIVKSSKFKVESGKTLRIEFEFDGNTYEDRGELPFAGCFVGTDCANSPELLIYNRYSNEFYLKKYNDGLDELSSLGISVDFESGDNVLLNNGKPGSFTSSGNDELLYYDKSGGSKKFNLIHHNGTGWTQTTMANIGNSGIQNFDLNESLYLVDDFLGTGEKTVLVLDEQRDITDPNRAPVSFYSFDTLLTNPILNINAPEGLDFENIFQNGSSINRNGRRFFRFFSGKFTSTSAQVLMVDMRTTAHKWYLGTISGNNVNFEELSGTANLNGIDSLDFGPVNRTRVVDQLGEQLIYIFRNSDGSTDFHRISISGSTISLVHYGKISSEYAFRWEFNHDNKPILHGADGVRILNINTSSMQIDTNALDETKYPEIIIRRPDLLTKVYPFRWIQGDYNGDGKTDIGIFHLKEAKWYFAMTQGTVPDLMHKVYNGIGGAYEMEYVNSTSFDNSGDDDIPDLPMNYKVCSKVTASDGQGNSIVTKYEYKNGFAVSAFINDKKETDYFGFGEFRVIDAYGSKTINLYHNVPYTDYRENRALGGAVKESRYIGYDNNEYVRTVYDYVVERIVESGKWKVESFLVYQSEARKFIKGILTQTNANNIEISGYEYKVLSRTGIVTDHYKDGAHDSESVKNFQEFEHVTETNQQRVKLRKSFADTGYETTTLYNYNTRGNLIKEEAFYSGTGLDPVANQIIEYEYDSFGNLLSQVDASVAPSRITEFGYDSALEQFLVVKTQVLDSRSLIWQYKINYDSAFGEIAKSTEPNGSSRYFGYDSIGRLTAISADTDSGAQVLARYEYEEVESEKWKVEGGEPLSAKTTQYSGAGSGDIETRVFKDGFGRVIHSVQSALDIDGRRYTRTGRVVYDAVGRVIKTSQTAWAGDIEIDRFIAQSADKHPTRTEYDSSGRVKKIIKPKAYSGEAETSVSFVYNDPWEVRETHSIGKGKRIIKNSRGQVLYVEDFGRNEDGSSLSAQMGFCYDIAGNRIKKMDLGGTSKTCPSSISSLSVPAKDTSGHNIAYWKYDAFGQLKNSSDPDFGVSSFEYNAFGDLISKTDARSLVTTFSYDRMGRMTQKILPGTEGTVIYTYDALTGSDNGLGRLVALDDPSQFKQFSYDILGRRKKETRNLKNPDTGELETPFETIFRYDLLDRTKEIDYPKDPDRDFSLRVCYGYNSFGYVRKVEADAVQSSTGCADRTIISNIDYNEFGQATQIERGNGIVTTYNYDIKGRLTNLLSTLNQDNGLTELQDVSYTFNTLNSIIKIDNFPSGYENGYEYRYDGLNRLVAAFGRVESEKLKVEGVKPHETASCDLELGTCNYSRKYDYALNGNLTAKEILDPASGTLTDSWTYSYSNHQVTSIHSSETGMNRFQMQYDASGNMISQSDYKKSLYKDMVYDSYNRIRKVTNPNTDEVIGQYYYDDQGFRVRRIAQYEEGNRTRYVELKYLSKYFAIEIQKNPSGTINQRRSSSVNNIYLNGVRIAALDHEGRTRHFLTDQVDSVKVIADDTGNVVSRFEYMPYGEVFVQEGEAKYSPKFNSQELDKETSYYFYNARHYDPEIARFVTADSVIDGALDTVGWNRYAYVRGNPIIYKDPTGHFLPGTHKDISEEVLSSKEFAFSKDAIEIVKAGNESVDKEGSHDPLQQNKHMMRRDLPTFKKEIVIIRDKTGNSQIYAKSTKTGARTESIKEARRSVAKQMQTDFNNAIDSAKKGNLKKSLDSLGRLHHNVQDRKHNYASLKEHGSIIDPTTEQNRTDLWPTKKQIKTAEHDTAAITRFFLKKLAEDLTPKEVNNIRRGFQNYRKPKAE